MKDKKLILNKQAKKYKKLLESYRFSSKFVRIGKNEFYLVYYNSFGKDVGMAIISPEQELPVNLYGRAFETILHIINISGTMLKNDRSRISMDPFIKTREYLQKILEDEVLTLEEKQIYQKCLITLNNNLQLQKELVAITEEFKKDLQEKNKNGFTVEDVEKYLDMMSEVDFIQYRQLFGDYKSIEYYNYINKHIKEPADMDKRELNEIKSYINEFAKNKEKQRAEIESISHFENIETLNREQHKQAFKEKFLKINNRYESLKNQLRFPKL